MRRRVRSLLPRPGRLLVVVVALAAISLATGCGANDTASGKPADGGASAVSPGGVSSGSTDPEQPSQAAGAGAASVSAPDQGVFGRITHEGRPVAGAMIQPDPGPGNPAPLRDSFAASAADGSYGVGLTPGAWDITISAAGYEPITLRVTVASDSAVQADAAMTRAR